MSLSQRGFTLLEISIAMLMISILLAGVLTGTGALESAGKSSQQEKQMESIETALQAYLKSNRHLPCPDIDGDGKEDRNSTSGVMYCTDRSGYLPYQDLSTDELDAWGNPFLYVVNARAEQANRINDICESASVFGQAGARDKDSGFAYCTATNTYYCSSCSSLCPSVCSFSEDPRDADQPPYFHLPTPPIGTDLAGDGVNSEKNLWLKDNSGDEIDNAIVAMIVSFGENGAKTWQNCNNGTTLHERENCDNDIEFSHATDSANRDYLYWLTMYDVKRAMLDSEGF